MIKVSCWHQHFLISKLQYFHDDIITFRWLHGNVTWSKILLKIFVNSSLNLLVNFYEKWITGTNFIEKKNLSVVLSYFGIIFTFALSHHWQNCNYSRANKVLVWNVQDTCEINFYIIEKFGRPLTFPIFFLLKIFFREWG